MNLKLNVTIKTLSLLSVVLTILFVTSCKSDKSSANPAELFDGPSVINFLVNSEQIPNQDRINKDFTMGEYREDRMNKDHVMYVPIYDTIYFKDISQFKGDAPGKRRWYLDEEELKSNNKEVAFYSEEVGPAIVTMKFDDFNYVMKGIFFTDAFDVSDPEAEEEIAATDETGDTEESFTMMSEDEIVADDDVYDSRRTDSKPIAETKPAVKEQTTSYKPQTQKAVEPKTTRPAVSKPIVQAPPKPVEIKTVDFTVSKLVVETGESISFKDNSFPAEAVKNQVWDWGDGNTMAVRRGAVKYSYLNPGTYTVKLCLNYSSNCASKKITVKKAAVEIIAAPEPKKEVVKVEEKPKPTVSRVGISAASTTLEGKPIEIKDETYPAEAVVSRAWYINGEKSNLTNKRFSKTFQKAGSYTIKLCVNGSSTLCNTKVITVSEKPKPKPVVVEKKVNKPTSAPASAPAEDNSEFFAMEASRSGLRSSQRCPDSDIEFFQGASELTLSPTVRMELMNARIYGQKVALAKVTLVAMDGSFTRTINKVQILPGPSTIEFGDLGVILQAGKKYKLKIEPMSSSEDLALENGGKCNTSFAADNRLAVSYKDNVMTLFDIKFGF